MTNLFVKLIFIPRLFSKRKYSLNVNHLWPSSLLTPSRASLIARWRMVTECLFRILSKPNCVLILPGDCLFAKNNLVLFQSYVALVLFSRTRSRKRNKISLRFPFSFFCMRLMVTWEAAFQSYGLCGPLAGLKVVTGAVSCGQGIFLISLLFQRESPHERGS